MENPCAVFDDNTEIFDPELGIGLSEHEFKEQYEDEEDDDTINWSLLCLVIGLSMLVIIICGLAIYLAEKHQWSPRGINIVFHVSLPDPIRGF